MKPQSRWALPLVDYWVPSGRGFSPHTRTTTIPEVSAVVLFSVEAIAWTMVSRKRKY